MRNLAGPLFVGILVVKIIDINCSHFLPAIVLDQVDCVEGFVDSCATEMLQAASATYHCSPHHLQRHDVLHDKWPSVPARQPPRRSSPSDSLGPELRTHTLNQNPRKNTAYHQLPEGGCHHCQRSKVQVPVTNEKEFFFVSASLDFR